MTTALVTGSNGFIGENLRQFEFMKFLINLDERKDRYIESLSELEKLGIRSGDITRFPAIKASPGLFGCLLSHLYCIMQGRNQDQSVMIFEDDFMLINDFATILPAALEELEQLDWCLFYFGGNICDKIYPETEHLGRLSWCQSTHAMVINKKYIDMIVLTVLSNPGIPIDLIYTHAIIPNFPCYITIPKMVAIQRESFSDIEQQNVNYNWMEDRYFANLQTGKKSDVTLDKT